MKDYFVESPIYDNWFKKHYPKESLLICSPYIKKDAIDKIISLYDIDKRSDFDFKVIIRGNANEFTYQRSSDMAAFESLTALKCFNTDNLKRITNLHMKAYLIDMQYLLITSGNMTNSGLFVVSGKENFEGGIATRDPSIVKSFLKYFSGIWNQGEKLQDFYDELLSAYVLYIENGYSDRNTLQYLNRKKYNFSVKTKSEDADKTINRYDEKSLSEEKKLMPYSLDEIFVFEKDKKTPDVENQVFSLDDIPPVGSLSHIPEVLRIVSQYEEGISFLELGRKLRVIFSGSGSTEDSANRKFGEEKGKFAAFLHLVNIESFGRNKKVKISNLGKTYMTLSAEAKNSLIKDVFFDKPIIVSIMKQSLETTDFDLFNFLVENCEGATKSTLRRKVQPLRELFLYISSICTEEELQTALNRV